MSKSFPVESMLKTLLKLPTKTLTRFKFASKEWYSIISNPTFVALHAKIHESLENGYLVQYKERNCRENIFSLCDKNMVRFNEVKLAINSIQIVGSCKGLVGLLLNASKDCRFPTYVWNPSARKCKKVPKHKSFVWEEEKRGIFASFGITGFGYDHRTNDFKILLIVHGKKIASEMFCNDIQVYSVRYNFWRRIQADIPCFPGANSVSTVYLKGAVYWLAMRKENDGTIIEIMISFDFSNEALRDRMLPDQCYSFAHDKVSIGVVKESIGLFVSSPGEDSGAGLGVCNVFVMKENEGVESWMNLFTVDLGGQLSWVYLGFGTNGEVMLRNEMMGNLYYMIMRLRELFTLEAVIGLLMLSPMQKAYFHRRKEVKHT